MSDVSFTSRIKFVDRNAFDSLRKGAYVDFHPDDTYTAFDMLKLKEIEKMFRGIRNPRLDVLKADEFYTDTVRTCTAGGVVDTKTGEAAGFHIFDCLRNSEKIDDILDNIFGRVKNPDRALIVGSKTLSGSDFSIPMFEKIYEGIAKRVPKVTVLREHTLPYSETNMHYSLKNDTWTLQSMYKPLTDYREFDVKSGEDLQKCFKEIKIADGDEMIFGGK
jgi:hypothetical protein